MTSFCACRHPDKNPDSKEECEAQMKELNVALDKIQKSFENDGKDSDDEGWDSDDSGPDMEDVWNFFEFMCASDVFAGIGIVAVV
jgi:hypothetical protein